MPGLWPASILSLFYAATRRIWMLTGKSLFWKLLVLLKRMVMRGVGGGGSSAPGASLSLGAPQSCWVEWGAVALGFLPGPPMRLTCWTRAGRASHGELLLRYFGLEEQPPWVNCWVVCPSIHLSLRAGAWGNHGRPGLDLQ